MVRHLGSAAGLILALSTTGCLLFTDSINVPPTVKIIPPGQLARGVDLVFAAEVHDDQTTPLTYDWRLAPGACADARDPLTRLNDVTLTVSLSEPGDYCVLLTVTDDFHARRDADPFAFRLDDQAPIAVISELTTAFSTPQVPRMTVPLYSQLRYTATASTDPDAIDSLGTPVWSVSGPDGGPLTPGDCGDGSGDVCLAVVTPGPYVLTLTVAGGGGATGTARLTVIVAADRAPCIVVTDPPAQLSKIIQNPAEDLTLAVTGVDDDGDPLPPISPSPAGPSQFEFVWSYWTSAGSVSRLTAYTEPRFPIPNGSYSSGQTLQVRAEVHDRVDRLTELDACYNAQPQPLTCEAPGGCKRWVTWTVEFR